MKAKFLIPEIDKKRFAENLSEEMRRSKLELKPLTEIGVEEVSTASIWQYREGKKFPTINRFLTICRFFLTAPDVFLSPLPKWIECEIDDVSKFSVLGKFNDVYYIAPNYKENSESSKILRRLFGKSYSKYFQKIPELSEEPDPASFFCFHFYGTKYDDTEKYHKGKIIYRFPKVNDVETSKKIANLLAEYNISKDQLQILLEYNQKESIRLRENNTRPWNLENIYKFSWIFNKPIEELLAIDYHEETHESLFDPVLFLEHYGPDENEIWDFNEEPVELLDKESQEGFFIIEEVDVPIEDD